MAHAAQGLEGQVAVVTGGGRGIGAGISARLAAMGATVVLCGRTRAPLEATAAAIRQAGGGGTSYDWLSGRNKGYGFAASGTPNRSVEEHRENIRVFLAMIDPNMGYIGDD